MCSVKPSLYCFPISLRSQDTRNKHGRGDKGKRPPCSDHSLVIGFLPFQVLFVHISGCHTHKYSSTWHVFIFSQQQKPKGTITLVTAFPKTSEPTQSMLRTTLLPDSNWASLLREGFFRDLCIFYWHQPISHKQLCTSDLCKSTLSWKDYGCAPLLPIYIELGIGSRVSCMLVEHSLTVARPNFALSFWECHINDIYINAYA